MKPIILICDTEEPGAFDRESSMAVLTLDPENVTRWHRIVCQLTSSQSRFSELREWGSYAEYYDGLFPERMLAALDTIAKDEAHLPDPSITAAQIKVLREQYELWEVFKWPDTVDFNLRNIVNLTALDYGEEISSGPIESMSVDIEEIVLEPGDFRSAAYIGDQQVYSKHINFALVVDPFEAEPELPVIEEEQFLLRFKDSCGTLGQYLVKADPTEDNKAEVERMVHAIIEDIGTYNDQTYDDWNVEDVAAQLTAKGYPTTYIQVLELDV